MWPFPAGALHGLKWKCRLTSVNESPIGPIDYSKKLFSSPKWSNLIFFLPAGGITHDTFQKELMCFDPDADKWTQKAPMTTVRGLHCMCTVGDRLYVIGGNHFRGTSDYDDVLSCEYYSPALDLWTPIAAMLRGQSDVGVAVFENKIYVVGGYSWNNRCMVEIVQKYDPEKDEWHKVFDLPESLGGIRACTLTVFPPEDISGSPSRESPLSAPWWVKGGGPPCSYPRYPSPT